MTNEAGAPEEPGAAGARARVESLFAAFDRLTPDELARIGFRPGPDEELDELMAAIDEAARRTGRAAMVDEARAAARSAVMHRFAEGAFHPTFVGLNWGISSGTIEDRVAIAETLANAGAAAVVADALDPEVAEAVRLDAAEITGLAVGVTSEFSLGRAIAEPADPDLRPSPRLRRLRRTAASVMVVLSIIAGGALVVAPVAVGIAALLLGRPHDPDQPSAHAGGGA